MSHISNNNTWRSYTLPKEDPKTMCITWHIPWVLLKSFFFLPKISKFCYIKKCRYLRYFPFRYLISNSYNFSWVSRDYLSKRDHNFDDVSKNDYPGPFSNTGFMKKNYDVLISVHDATNKIFSHDSNYNLNVVMWPKFGNSNISVREVITTSIL